jgi:hypothetical protein
MALPPSPEPEAGPADDYDALDEALMETFPASDPVAVSEPLRRPELARGAAGLAIP